MNPFMRGFLSDIYLRPSCYECRCKNGASHSDLTIADFWGIHIVDPEFDDDKGVGLVLVNTPVGKAYFDKLDMAVRESTLAIAHQYNGGFNEHTKAHSKRNLFFSLIAEGKTIRQAVEVCLRIPLYIRAIRKAKHLVKAVAKRVLGGAGTRMMKKMLGNH